MTFALGFTNFYYTRLMGNMGVAILGCAQDKKFCSDRKSLIYTNRKVCEKCQTSLKICRF